MPHISIFKVDFPFFFLKMAYLLDEMFVLNNFERGDKYLYFDVHGEINEINEVMSEIYGENKMVDLFINFQAYEFENVRVQYVKNWNLTVKVFSPDNEKIDCLENLIKEI